MTLFAGGATPKTALRSNKENSIVNPEDETMIDRNKKTFNKVLELIFPEETVHNPDAVVVQTVRPEKMSEALAKPLLDDTEVVPPVL